MKKKITGTVFFALIVAFSVPAQEKKKETELNSLKEIQEFTRAEAKKGSYEKITIRANADSSAWENLFSSISKNKNLHHLVLDRCNIEDVPKSAKNIVNLHKLQITNCLSTLYEDWIDELYSLNIKSFTISAEITEDVPQNISLFSVLDTFTIVNENISSGGAQIKKQQEKFHISKYNNVVLQYEYVDEPLSDYAVSTIEILLRQKNIMGQRSKMKNEDEFFQSPIENVEVGKQTEFVEAGEGAVLVMGSKNTIVNIPENAFVDRKGKTVKGNVLLEYREFRTAGDIIASGIPMSVHNEKENGDMETAGMFEMKASVNGEEVFIDPGKSIGMNFIPEDTLKENYNFYSLNEEKRSWANNGSFSATTAGNAAVKTIKVNSPAVEVYRKLTTGNMDVVDRMTLTDRFYDNHHRYVLHTNSKKEKVSIDHQKETRVKNLLRFSEYKTKKGEGIAFKIKYFWKTHGELNNFNGYYFFTSGYKKTFQFKNSLTARGRYNDIRVNFNNGNYELEMKNEFGIQKIPCTLMRMNMHDSLVELKDGGARVFKRYQRRLKIREKVFNIKAERGQLEDNTYPKFVNENDRAEYAYATACKFMLPAETKMPKQEWIEKGFTVDVPAVNYQGYYDNGMTAMFSLKKFGIYNCDRLYHTEQKAEVFAQFKTGTGEIFAASNVFLVLNRNTVITYANGFGMTVPTRGKIGLMLVSPDGKIAVMKYRPVKAGEFNAGDKVEFVVNEVAKPADPNDITALLGL